MSRELDPHLVSFRQLCDWLDLQDPAVLAKLHRLSGAPAEGWADYLA